MKSFRNSQNRKRLNLFVSDLKDSCVSGLLDILKLLSLQK